MSLDVNISEPEEFNCFELHKVVQDVAVLLNVKDFEYHVDFVAGKGDNYIANLFRLIIKDINNENSETIKLIVKTLINSTREELFRELHIREVYVYNEVIPNFEKLMKTYYKDGMLKIAKCYKTYTDIGNEVIILEDLVEKGFQINESKKFINYKQACVVFRKLAKFHALSFILERDDPETFEKLKCNCKDVIFDNVFLNKDVLMDYFLNSFRISAEVILNKGIRANLLKNVLPNLIYKMKQFSKPRKCNVLCHGDFWINNILFKIEEGKTVDVTFLDFQAVRYACPVTDIMYFIYLCTDAEFREKHLQDLLSLYYETLKTVLANCKIDINEVYPKDTYKDDINELRLFGFLGALVELKLMTVLPDDVHLMKELKIDQEVDDVIGELRLYVLRVNEIVNEFSANGYIDKL